MKSVHFSVDLAFEITLKQHTNFCNQSQTDTCRNNQWLSLDFDCRQTSAISIDKTFAVHGPFTSYTFINFEEIFTPTRLIPPTRLLDTVE